MSTPANSYDEVPYASHPYAQSCPERLATIATLFGMRPAPPERCRVLELGCCSGGNLLPMAERTPDGEFVGIDLSARQIADGQARLEALGLRNVRLLHQSISDVSRELGTFDYIICHGVYSWVPQPVREKVLAVCAENLAPGGVAYVSYNTYPGWHLRGIIRDVMVYRAAAFAQPAERLRHARALLDFLVQSVPAEDNPYGLLLRKEVEQLRDKEDAYLHHDHLEEINEPTYFNQFMATAEEHGLQYLGEADFGIMSLQNLPPAVEALLRNLTADIIEMEQYMDFVRNRMFRQTLLCHRGVALDRTLPPERLLGLHVASSARPEAPVMDVQSAERAVFRGPHSVTTTTDPLVKAALLHLAEVWPLAVPFSELLAVARSGVAGAAVVVVDTAQATPEARRLAGPLLRCYATASVELSLRPPTFTTAVSERPAASPYARLQAETSNPVTNRRHETVRLNDLQRHLLRHLDGSRDRAGLLEVLAELVGRRVLVLRESGQSVKDAARVTELLGQALDQALAQLAGQALLAA